MPSPPLTNLVAWYDANAETGYTNGVNANAFHDQSGNGLTLTGINAYPTWNTNVLNGMPGMLFTNNASFQDLTVFPSWLINSGAFTAIILFGMVASSSVFNAWFSAGGFADYNNDIIAYCSPGSPGAWQVDNGADGGASGTTNLNLDTFYVNSIVFNGSGSGNSGRLQVYINGNQETLSFAAWTVPSTTANMGLSLTLGDYSCVPNSVTNLNGYICEALFYSVALDPTTRAEVESYLNTKWNLGGGSTVSGTGTASGSSTASGVGASLAISTGTMPGSSSCNAVGVSLAKSTGTSAGSSTCTGTGASLGIASFTSQGSSTASATALSVGSAKFTSQGSSTANATGASLAISRGTASGNSTASGISPSTGGTIVYGGMVKIVPEIYLVNGNSIIQFGFPVWLSVPNPCITLQQYNQITNVGSVKISQPTTLVA